MKLQPETTQKIFIVWFALLTMMATFNFYSNIKDSGRQSELERSYEQNAGRYEQSIEEHKNFKETHDQLRQELNYLRGRVDSMK